MLAVPPATPAAGEAPSTGPLARVLAALHRVPTLSAADLAVVGLLFACLTVALWGGTLRLGLRALDDHEIVNYLGADHELRLGEVPARIAAILADRSDKEVRPTTYSLHVLETFLWGDDARLWYAARLAMFCAMAGCLGWVASRRFGLAIGCALVVALFTAPYWSRIWARLMRTEIYAGVGVALFLLGVERALDTSAPRRRLDAGLLVLAGTLLAAGAKESFVALALPTAALLIWLRRRGSLSPRLAILLGAALAFDAFVAAALWRELAATGTDYYGGAVGADRLAPAWAAIAAPDPIVLPALLCAGLALAATVRLRFGWRWPASLRRDFAGAGLVGLLFALLYFWQLVYYGGGWTLDSPYAFPGELWRWGCWLAAAWPLARRLREAPPRFALAAQSLLAVALVGWTAARGFQPHFDEVAYNRADSERFQAAIARTADAAAREPRALVVLSSRSWDDIEPAWATKSFLAYAGLDGRIVLDFAPEAPSSFSPEMIAEWRRGGALDRWMAGDGGFTPRRALQPDTPCLALSVTAGRQPEVVGCRSLGGIYDAS